MSLLRTGFATSLAVAIRMAAGLVLAKVLAVALGPAGFAVVGQFQNLVTVAQTFTSGAIAQGVTKYTAEEPDVARRTQLWRTAGSLSLLGTGLISMVLLVFSGPLAARLLFGEGDRLIIVALAGGLIFLSVNGLLLAVLTGLKEVRLFVLASIGGSVLTTAFTVVAAKWFGLTGALVALAVNQSAALVATLLVARREGWLRPSSFIGGIDRRIARQLGGYALMALTTALTVPLGQLAIRWIVVDRFGLEAAGFWDAVTRLSTIYLLFFTSVLSVWYLPRIAQTKSLGEAMQLARWLGLRILPLVLLACATVWLVREFVVVLVFDDSFLGALPLFAPQLTGDFLKMASWVAAYLLVGKALIRTFVVLELVFGTSLVLLTLLFCSMYGFVGVSVAYAVNYLLYGIAVLLYLRARSGLSSETV